MPRRCSVAFAAGNYSMKEKEKIPLFKTWTHWYVFVVGFLILLIALFYLLTKHFA